MGKLLIPLPTSFDYAFLIRYYICYIDILLHGRESDAILSPPVSETVPLKVEVPKNATFPTKEELVKVVEGIGG